MANLFLPPLACRSFYNARVDRKRQMETNRRNRERLMDPNFFPAVPKGKPV